MRCADKKSGFVSIVAIGIIALVVLGATYISVSDDKISFPLSNNRVDTRQEFSAQQTDSSASDRATKLKSELQLAVKSGGINPARYDAIVSEIRELRSDGADEATLAQIQSLLQELSVGGRTFTKPKYEKPVVQTNVAPRETVVTFWEYNPSTPERGWYWTGREAPPACPDPLVIESPIDVNLATGILYPGQVRGDGPEDFKPHGGFSLKPNSKIEIRAPMDGYLTNVARFTDEFGYHVSLIFQNPCGIQFYGGHWGSLPPDIQAVVDKIPINGYGDSRTEQVADPYFVKKGQIIVTGLQEKVNPERPGFDWGIMDYRQQNAASKDEKFRQLYGYAHWNTYYGVCWLDLLPPDQKNILKSLPGVDGKQGKNSEYCTPL